MLLRLTYVSLNWYNKQNVSFDLFVRDLSTSVWNDVSHFGSERETLIWNTIQFYHLQNSSHRVYVANNGWARRSGDCLWWQWRQFIFMKSFYWICPEISFELKTSIKCVIFHVNEIFMWDLQIKNVPRIYSMVSLIIYRKENENMTLSQRNECTSSNLKRPHQ